MQITDITDITDFTGFIENGIMVGCSRCTYPSIQLSFRLRWHSEDHGRLTAGHVSKHVRRNHLVWTPFEAIALPFLPPKNLFFFLQSGKPGQDTQENGHVSGKPGRTHELWTRGIRFFYKTQRGRAPLRTSAARGARSCTTAPASCRRPGTRTGCQAVTPRPEPQHAARGDQHRAFGQKAD